MDGLDRFAREAFAMVSGPAARAAFDISARKTPGSATATAATVGPEPLLARRLVEAGVRFVTLNFGGWDMHSSLEKGMKRTCRCSTRPSGRWSTTSTTAGCSTRRWSSSWASSAARRGSTRGCRSDPVPGRDHWGEVMSVLMAGGGLARGRVVGSSNAKGEIPKDRPTRPIDVWATVYHQLGLDLRDELPQPRRAGRSRSRARGRRSPSWSSVLGLKSVHRPS